MTYTAQLDPGDRGCTLLSNTAYLLKQAGQQQAALGILTCGSGLGREAWWTFESRDIGPDSTAEINVANGNAVISAADSTPVPARGRLGYSLNRTYNSSTPSTSPYPAPSESDGHSDLGEMADAPVDAIGGSGLVIPTFGIGAQTVSNPLSVVLIDRDGTRHLFKARALPHAVPAVPARGDVRARTLSAPGTQTLCVDMAYDSPPGVHLGLWRYIARTDTTCATASSTDSIVGFASVRPDRLRTEYDALGRVRAVIDGSGVQLRYLYAPPDPTKPEGDRLTAIFEPLSCQDAGSTPTTGELRAGTCRAITLAYTGGTQPTVVITDPAHRKGLPQL